MDIDLEKLIKRVKKEIEGILDDLASDLESTIKDAEERGKMEAEQEREE